MMKRDRKRECGVHEAQPHPGVWHMNLAALLPVAQGKLKRRVSILAILSCCDRNVLDSVAWATCTHFSEFWNPGSTGSRGLTTNAW